MSDAIGKSVCLLLWGGVSYIVLASILILAADFTQEHLLLRAKNQPLSKAKVCSAAAVCIVAAIAVLVVVYGFVYILTKGV